MTDRTVSEQASSGETASGRFLGRVITLGVASGIACYRAVDLLRDLQRDGARVRVILTAAAAELLRPALFEALSGERVGTALWDGWPEGENVGEFARFPHLDFARGIDALVVAPATANVLGKAAHGIGDDLLTTTLLAVDSRQTPVLFVPSMNHTMHHHPAVSANRDLLRERGCSIVAPGEGPLACGEYGTGRWPGNSAILAALDRLLNGSRRLEGRHVVVTAGRTEADIDPARTLTNRSSGKMGFALARAAWRHGARVTLIHGPTAVMPPPFVEVVPVRTSAEMGAAVRSALPGSAHLWMAAAVNDWQPAQVAERKLKRGEWDGVLRLEPGEDILARAVVERDPGTIVIGFAVETDDVEVRAREKLKAKGCDYLVANNPLEAGAGFGHDTNRVTLIDEDGSRVEFERMAKEALAERLVAHVLDHAGARAAR
ncbi:MAG: bifunctional phosphopantothenoylcysteine decarboxylase/phosphopantothenate--cysteine ligase CoaBC [Gemmatimonadetes bacterium]|nr:bifunctional phosphopantothenoylcysteine decarboxylase/phosphopantothenate--cysteine ligase CoaBC [Gemmatimonadota bacterium]